MPWGAAGGWITSQHTPWGPTLFLSQWSNGRMEEAAVGALMMTVVVLAVVVLVRRLVLGNVRTPTVA